MPELGAAQAGLLLAGCGFTHALGKEVAASANKPKPAGVYSVGPKRHLKAHNAVQARLLELEAAAIAAFVLPLRQQGASARQLTLTLNDLELKTRRGSKWHLSGVAEACYWLKESGNDPGRGERGRLYA